MNLWEEILARIETKVNRHSFYTWFKPTMYVSADARTITVRVPNPLFKDWLMKHYAGVITEAMGEIRRPNLAIDFVSEQQTDEAPRPVNLAEALPSLEEDLPPTAAGGSAGLNPRDTVGTFTVGASDQCAPARLPAVGG